MHLSTNMRLSSQYDSLTKRSLKDLQDAQWFADWLLEIGEGRENQETKVSLPSSNLNLNCPGLKLGLCLPLNNSPIDQIIDRVYHGIDTIETLSESMRQTYFSERVILAPLNVDVDELNDACIDRLTAHQSKTFLSIDAAINESGHEDFSIPKEYLNTINISGLPRYSITLKKTCPIILLRNLNHSLAYVMAPGSSSPTSVSG